MTLRKSRSRPKAKRHNCTHKRADPAWFEGQEVERPAVRAMLPAFARSTRAIWAEVDFLIAELEANPLLDIMASLAKLPWDQSSEDLISAWEVVAARAHRQAGLMQVKVVHKVDGRDVRQRSVMFGRMHALELAEVTTLGSQAGVQEAIVIALQDNVSSLDLAKRIRQSVGLTARSVRALEKLRKRLEADGVAPAKLQRQIDRAAGRARKQRAETIARTEVNRARNAGTMDVWQTQRFEGDLPHEVMKVWVANPGCPICVTIQENGPVPLDQPFMSPDVGPLDGPPAHPRCRCSPALVFP